VQLCRLIVAAHLRVDLRRSWRFGFALEECPLLHDCLPRTWHYAHTLAEQSTWSAASSGWRSPIAADRFRSKFVMVTALSSRQIEIVCCYSSVRAVGPSRCGWHRAAPRCPPLNRNPRWWPVLPRVSSQNHQHGNLAAPPLDAVLPAVDREGDGCLSTPPLNAQPFKIRFKDGCAGVFLSRQNPG